MPPVTLLGAGANAALTKERAILFVSPAVSIRHPTEPQESMNVEPRNKRSLNAGGAKHTRFHADDHRRSATDLAMGLRKLFLGVTHLSDSRLHLSNRTPTTNRQRHEQKTSECPGANLCRGLPSCPKTMGSGSFPHEPEISRVHPRWVWSSQPRTKTRSRPTRARWRNTTTVVVERDRNFSGRVGQERKQQNRALA